MPQTDQQKIIEIKVRIDDAVQGIAKYTQAINQLKNEQQQLKNELKQGTMSQQQYNAAMAQNREKIKSYNASIRALSKEYQSNIKIQKAEEGSLVALREQLNMLRKEYDRLGNRESNRGQQLQKEIQDINKTLMEAEAATGRFQRNVGNYASGFNGLNVSVQQILKEMPNAAMSMNTFFLAISNNIPMLVDEINRLREANRAAVAEGRSGISVWRALSGALFSWNTVISVGVTLLTVYGGEIVKWIGSLFKAKEQNDHLKEAMDGVNEAMRNGQKNAQEELVNLRLLYNATQDTTKSYNERKTAVDKLQEQYPAYFANMSDEEILAGKAATAYNNLADSILRSAMARAAQDKIVDNMKTILELQEQEAEAIQKQEETQQKLNAAVGMYQNMAQRPMLGGASGQSMIVNQLSNEVQYYGDQAADARKQIEVLIAANRKLAGSININDLTTDYGAGDYNARQKAERDAEKERNKLAKQSAKDAEQEQKAREEAQQRELEEQRKAQDLLYDLVLSGYEKRRQMVSLEYDRQIEDIKRNLATEKNLTEGEREQMNAQISLLEREKNDELDKLSEEQMQKDIETQMQITNNELAAVGDNIDKWRELKLKQIDEEQQLAEIRLRNQIEDETVLNEALLAMQSAYNAERVAINKKADAEIAKQNASFLGVSNEQWGNVTSMTDAASQALRAFGQENKALTALSKTLALATVAINTGKAISEAIAANAGKPWGFAAIAGLITQIMSAMATATSIINSAKFATGGLVTGPGTGTSDSIPAMLSNGESVMTARATSMFAPLLSAINQLGGGVPITAGEPTPAIGEEFLANAIAKGMERMPRPVVSVQEISKVSKRVEVIERMGRV